MNLNDVFLVPKLSINLISVGQLVENNCKISFSPIGCLIQELEIEKLIGRGRKDERPFTFTQASHNTTVFFASSKDDSNKLWTLWYRKLEHSNFNKLSMMFHYGFIGNKITPKESFYSSVVLVKVKVFLFQIVLIFPL